MRDDGNRGDLQVCRAQFLKFFLEIDLAESHLYLVFDVLLEEGDGVLGSFSRMGAVVHHGRDDVPGPIWATANRNPVPPFLQGWRERVDLRKRLGLHSRAVAVLVAVAVALAVAVTVAVMVMTIAVATAAVAATEVGWVAVAVAFAVAVAVALQRQGWWW